METSGKKKLSPRPRKKATGEYRHGDLRNAVLNAAALLVAQRAGPEFSLREIAERVGVKHTAIYRHFASKEGLISALATRAFERLAERFQVARTACGDDGRAYLEALADAYFVTVQEEPGAYRVMFSRVTQEDAERQQASQACFHALVEGFARAQKLGIVRSDRPAVALAAANWSAMHGLAMLMLDQRLDNADMFGSPTILNETMRLILREGWSAKVTSTQKAKKKIS